jgi:hypothetical protein
MICRVSILVFAFLPWATAAPAQDALPDPGSYDTGAEQADKPDKPAKPKKPRAPKAAKVLTPGAANIDGRPLLLNGQSGLLQISGSGDPLQVDKLRLAGESVSDSSQKCVVDIVAEAPIKATSVGRPDGLERYEVDVPACPFAFDVLDGAVLVPPQITACVFKAADCQTSPGGLWGPDASQLDAAEIGKRRSQAEKAMAKALREIEALASTNPDAANLVRDQNGFASARDDSCRSYVKENIGGYCAASLTEARAALLQSRLEGFAAASKTGRSAADTKKKKKPNSDVD